MAKKVYICEHCGKLWSSRMDARWCEILHEHNDKNLIAQAQFLQELKQSQNDPCRYCEQGYYIYGTDFVCACGTKCKDYCFFSLKQDIN